MDFSLRKAVESDFEEIISLFKEFALFEKRPEKMLNTLELLQEEKEYFNCFLAVSGEGEILGYATFYFAYHTWKGKCMHMDDLYVKEAFRGEGIGKSLVDAVIKVGKEEKCKDLRWQVSDWNVKAQAFYESLGAEISSGEWNCVYSY